MSQQGGYSVVAGSRPASIWSGTADSYADLHPSGDYYGSYINATTGEFQAGEARIGGEYHAAPNGRPATPLGNAGAAEGPPSVS